ncbi:stage II sporulation protein M [Timonella sp. A28]|uniref:stage II sporulation protein M n=1 Tax=Timonella sp. A28 TaxID=3442640 RepID=UPI003EBB03FD
MDFDAFSNTHKAQWDRLKQLTRTRKLSGREADELIALYQTTATHLSMLRSMAPDPTLISELSLTLVRARARIVGAHNPRALTIKRFFVQDLPAAFYRTRWWSHGVTAVFILVAVIAGFWVATSSQGLEAMGTETQRLDYVDTAFEAYYNPGVDFAAVVWTNNAWIAAQCVAFGVTGIWPAFVLANNAVAVGSIGGMMAHYGEAGKFFALILPHGLLELTAIFVAGGAGLKLFWTLIAPGNRPRSLALAQEGRALITIAVGLVFALALSGLIEGFVTGSALAWWLKIVIGALALALFWTYVYTLGRSAVHDGATGDLDEAEAGYSQLYA